MKAPTIIARQPLLLTKLGKWNTTSVDVRSIRFEPGQQTGVHRHPCHVVGYIVAGSALLQVEGEEEQRLEAGSAFHEPAGKKMLRFNNASTDQPLHFITFYLQDGDQPLIEMLDA